MTSTNIRIVEISVAERFDDAMVVLAESWADMAFDFELRPDARNLAAVERSPHPFNPSVVVCAASAPAVAPRVPRRHDPHAPHPRDRAHCQAARRAAWHLPEPSVGA